MSWKHWTAVVLVIGLGIVAQIPRHQETAGDGTHQHATVDTLPSAAPSTDDAAAEPAGPYRTIALEVTGMT